MLWNDSPTKWIHINHHLLWLGGSELEQCILGGQSPHQQWSCWGESPSILSDGVLRPPTPFALQASVPFLRRGCSLLSQASWTPNIHSASIIDTTDQKWRAAQARSIFCFRARCGEMGVSGWGGLLCSEHPHIPGPSLLKDLDKSVQFSWHTSRAHYTRLKKYFLKQILLRWIILATNWT